MLSLRINKLRGHANKECKHPTLKKVLPCKPEKPYSRINRNKDENQRTEKCQPLQKHQIVRHQIPLTERTSKTTPVGQKNAHFFKPPNSTRTHRTPSKAKKGTSPIVPRNTPLLKIKNQCPPHMLGSVIRQSNNSSNNAAKHQKLQKHVPRNHHTPRSFIK